MLKTNQTYRISPERPFTICKKLIHGFKKKMQVGWQKKIFLINK